MTKASDHAKDVSTVREESLIRRCSLVVAERKTRYELG
jgi:hypothetical protein